MVRMDTVSGTQLHYGDFVVIATYFAFVLFVGLWTSRQNRGSAGGYFLAGRNMNWIPVGASLFASNIGSIHFVGLAGWGAQFVGASLFASNIGSIHFVGLAGSGAASGIAIGLYELNALYIVLMLGYLFLPVYIASGVYTMPEYLQRRFGGQRIQIYLAVLALLAYIFTKISADLYAGALFIEQALKWDIYGAISLLLAIAALFTITGGLTAVIWTDFIQTIIMIIGAFTLMFLGFDKVGGYSGMVEKYAQAMANSTVYSNSSCGKPRDDYIHLFRDPVTGDLPWPGIIGLTINSVWYWCSDQVIVQRALAGKTYDHAKAGTILCGFLKILPLFLLVFPGMIARILYPETIACVDPDVCKEICGSSSGCSNIAYPTLVINLMPPGARGMMLAVMMAALMSSLTSIFNSSSTIFAMDIWTRIRKSASELEIMIVGRVFVIFLVVVSIAWIPVIRASQGSELFVYIQQVSSFMQPPICCIFLLGLFWPRLNELGAFVALVVGMIVGLIRFIVEYAYTVPDCLSGLPDPRPSIVKDFHYLYFASFLFVLTGICAVSISLLTKPIDSRCLERLTWWSRSSKRPRLDIDKWMAGEEVFEMISESDNKDDETNESHNEYNTKENGMQDNNIIELHRDPWPKEFPITNSQTVDKERTSVPKRVFNWICGIEKQESSHLSSHTVKTEDMISIKEHPIWSKVADSAAILLSAVALFLFIFFA